MRTKKKKTKFYAYLYLSIDWNKTNNPTELYN